MILFSVITNRIEGKIAMIFDQSLQAYLHEVDDVLVAWEEKPSGNFEMEAQLLAANYHKNLYRILAFILPHLQEFYGYFTDKEATEKLTKVFYDMSEQLYKNANPNGAQGVDPNAASGAGTNNGSDANNGGDNGNVYDADYKVEDDEK